MTVTLEDQISEVKRELRMREVKYPNWIATGMIKEAAAKQQLERMRAVLATLEMMQKSQEPSLL